MFHIRMGMALDTGALTLPEGAPLVVCPPLNCDLQPLNQAQVFSNDYNVAKQFSATVTSEICSAPAVVVCLPRSREYGQNLIESAARHAQNLVVVDGAKTDGADAIWRSLRKIVPGVSGLSKAHGRIFWFEVNDAVRSALSSWRDPGIVAGEGGFLSQSGIYCAGKIDAGSKLLLDVMPDDLGKRVADLGSGWGYLAQHVLRSQKLEVLHAVDIDRRAIECAQLNIADSRVHFHWNDATTWRISGGLDAVVMNPPFHTGRQGSPELGIEFIKNAAALLTPRGALWMVANRHLPYENVLEKSFARVEEVHGDNKFKVFNARGPRR